MGEDERDGFYVNEQNSSNKYDENDINEYSNISINDNYSSEDYENENENENSIKNTGKVKSTYVDEDGNEVEYVEYQIAQTTVNAWSVSATIFGVISLVIWIIPAIGFATSIIGILFSAISFRYTKASSPSKSSLSKKAFTMSIIGFFVTLAYSIIKVILFIM